MKSTLILNNCGRCNVTQPPFKGLLDVSNYDGNSNTSFLMMAKRYCDVQMLFFSELQKQLNQVQVLNTTNPVIEAEEIATTGDVELIRGTRELAKFLRCGGNRANAIAKSGILKRAGIQFKMGNTNCYIKKKLTEALSSNPDLFKDLHWH
jgi:hypothetical protein